MNLRDIARHVATAQRIAKTAPKDLRAAADLIETGSALVEQLAGSPFATAAGIAQALGAPKAKRPPPVRAPSTASFRPPTAPKPQPPIRVAPAEVIVATIDDEVLDATVIDPRRPAPKRSR